MTDSEWMSLIDGERVDGLQKCCANISALRDVIMGIARDGGYVHFVHQAQLKRTLGWAIGGHDGIDEISAIVKIASQMDIDLAELRHENFDGPESLVH